MNTVLRSTLLSSAAVFAKANEGAGASGKAPGNEPAPPPPPAGAVTEGLGNANLPVKHTAPVIAQNAVVLGGKAFKVKQVTRNVFPQRAGQTLFVQITGTIYQGKALEHGKSEMAPAELAEVANLETGELGLIIVNKVLRGQLEELYPNGAYVGKSFAVTMRDVEGKRYKAFTVYELEATAAE